VTFHHRLKDVATGDIAMSIDFKCVLLDLEKRKSVPIPDDIRQPPHN
jgi:acyl-CoA thioesterase FadM